MSPVNKYSSRKGEVPCGDGDLYAFLTDMRNLKTIIPKGFMSEWDATEDKCSFKIDKIGKVTASLSSGLPYSVIAYDIESFLTGKVRVQIMIEYISGAKSSFTINAALKMNPLMRMFLGDSSGKYLDILINAIESYDGFDKIRGYNQSP